MLAVSLRSRERPFLLAPTSDTFALLDKKGRSEKRGGRMSSENLIRWSGSLAIPAGAYLVLSPFVHPSSPRSAAWVPVHLLSFAALIATLLALVGILAYQLRQTGRLGLAGFLVAFVGTAMMLMDGREHLFSPDFGVGTPRGL